MVTATLSRGGTSVDLPLIETGGTPLISVDYGKPELQIQNTGTINPRALDQWSGIESYRLSGRLVGSSAYDDAITLADLVKSGDDGNGLILDVPGLDEIDSNIRCAPAAGQEEALVLEYPPGQREMLNFDLSLTRINQSLADVSDQTATTPTAAGSGPIEIRGNGSTVEMTRGVSVTRSCGRPAATVRRASNSRNPNYYDKFKSAFEGFEISFETGPDALSDVTDIVDMFKAELGRDALTLDFNGIFGMGEFDVVPQGSGALRNSRQAGEQGVVIIPTVSLRRVQT